MLNYFRPPHLRQTHVGRSADFASPSLKIGLKTIQKYSKRLQIVHERQKIVAKCVKKSSLKRRKNVHDRQ